MNQQSRPFLKKPIIKILRETIKHVIRKKGSICENSEAYLEPSWTSKMKLLTEIVSGFQTLTFFAKGSILKVPLNSEWGSEISLYYSACRPNGSQQNQNKIQCHWDYKSLPCI